MFDVDDVMVNKEILMQEAAAGVSSGCTLALGGMTLYRRPMEFVRALLNRFYSTGEPRDLTLLSFAAGLESDLLVGAGIVSRVRACYFGLEIFGLAPMFIGFAVALVFGIISLKIVAVSVLKKKFPYFAFYCVPLGALVIVLSLAGVWL